MIPLYSGIEQVTNARLGFRAAQPCQFQLDGVHRLSAVTYQFPISSMVQVPRRDEGQPVLCQCPGGVVDGVVLVEIVAQQMWPIS